MFPFTLAIGAALASSPRDVIITDLRQDGEAVTVEVEWLSYHHDETLVVAREEDGGAREILSTTLSPERADGVTTECWGWDTGELRGDSGGAPEPEDCDGDGTAECDGNCTDLFTLSVVDPCVPSGDQTWTAETSFGEDREGITVSDVGQACGSGTEDGDGGDDEGGDGDECVAPDKCGGSCAVLPGVVAGGWGLLLLGLAGRRRR